MIQTLLIAEGDPDLRDVFREFLTREGYRVETAADALDCVKKVREVMPAVLVLDLGLLWGGADGVLAWLREGAAMFGVPVVLTAPAGETRNLTRLIIPPVVSCLSKPFALTALLASVRSAVAPTERETREQQCVYPEFFIG